jgi:hemolysin activation/secretion protein
MKCRPTLVLFVIAACVLPLHAQQPLTADPGAVQKRSEETFQYYDLQKKLENLQRQKSSSDATKSNQAAPDASAGQGGTFLVRRVMLTPSELLSSQELTAISAKYEGRQISIADLNRLVGDINDLYKSKGDVTARAMLPPQQIRNGEVRITLIEGRVGNVSIANTTRTRDSYILNSLRLKPGQLIHVDDLQQNLMFLNNTSDLKVKAVLQPGAAFGTSDLELQVEEPRNQSTMFFFDNAGRDGVGNQRLGLVERYSSLLGLRDPLTVGIYGAAGTLDYFTAYEIPVNRWGTRLGANFDDSHIQILSGSTQKYGIAGHSMNFVLKLSQPLVMSPRVHWTASLSADYIKSLLQSQNVPLSNTLVRSLDLNVNLDIIDHRGLWSFVDTLTSGYFNVGGTRNFLKYDSSIVRMENLKWGITGLVRVTGQTNALNYLPTVEQFQVGGVATVRGYPEGRQIGDRGYTGTAELQLPAPFRRDRIFGLPLRGRLREDLFFDTGAVYDSYRTAGRPPSDNRYLTSVGGGLIVNFSRYFSGRFDCGVPLRNTRGISAVGFHFYVQSSPPLAGLLRKFGQASWSALRSSPDAGVVRGDGPAPNSSTVE